MGPTHRADADSDSREYIPTADSPFYRFSTPPFRLSFHLCFRVVPVCVSSFSVWDSLGPVAFGVVSRAKKALRVVLRGFVVLPLFTQGQHYAVYLFFTTGGGGSVSLITPYWFLVRGLGCYLGYLGLFGVSLRLQCHGALYMLVRDIVPCMGN